jgi:hypothetical protein
MNGKRGWTQAAVVLVLAMLGGCTAMTGGRIVSEGRGTLVYRAPCAGQVAVKDVTLHTELYQGAVAANALVEMDPFTQQIRVERRVVAQPMTSAADEYRISFKAAKVAPVAAPASEPASEPATAPATEAATEAAPASAPAPMPAP